MTSHAFILIVGVVGGFWMGVLVTNRKIGKKNPAEAGLKTAALAELLPLVTPPLEPVGDWHDHPGELVLR